MARLAAVVLSWAMLIVMAGAAAQRGLPGDLGPGGAMLRALPDLPLPAMLERFVALCLSPAPRARLSLPLFLALWAMWMLMALAMMLPAAAPMLRTYCEIADTARARAMRSCIRWCWTGGYLVIWALAALGFAAAGIRRAGGDGRGFAGISRLGIAAPVALAIAGLYQFSGLKEACLEKCRNPFATLFSNWSTHLASRSSGSACARVCGASAAAGR
jgi:predicted metal-binding membrane protein